MAAADEQNRLRQLREMEAKQAAEAKEAARQKRMDELKAEREARMKAEAEARAKSNPMLDPTNRPEAPPADDKFVYFYSWIGGVNTGSWKLYKESKSAPQYKVDSAINRSSAGETQATFSSSVGANTVTKPTTPSGTTPSGTTPPGTTGPGTQPGKAWVLSPDGKSWVKPTMPTDGEYTWNDDTGWTKKSTTGPGTQPGKAWILSPDGKSWIKPTMPTDGEYTWNDDTGWTKKSTTPPGSSSGTSGFTQADIDAAIAKATAAAVAGLPKGLTQEDLDRAINEALAKQAAANAAAAREAKAAEDALKLAQKQKASDRLVALFKSYGLETLAGFIDRRIKADVSEEMLMVELYDQPEYQLRFPGMKALRAKGKTITEKDYIDNEKAFIQTARFFDLPKGFYDSPDDFGALIGNLVSPKEYQDRLQVGQDLARSLNPAVRSQLIEFYGVGEGDLTAFVLDADRALPLIQKQAKAAQFVGIGRAAGFTLGGMTAQQAENIAGTESYAKLSEAELTKALGAAGQLRSTQQRLARLEGVEYNEQEALSAVIEGSQTALLASQQRAQREAARFSNRSGISGSTLRSTTAI
jgi:hypothetical protein